MGISLKVKQMKDRYPDVLEVALFSDKGVEITSMTKSESSIHLATESRTSTGVSMNSSSKESSDHSGDLAPEDTTKG
jgi:hypothetical protein